MACQRVGVASSYVASALVVAALALDGLALALDTLRARARTPRAHPSHEAIARLLLRPVRRMVAARRRLRGRVAYGWRRAQRRPIRTVTATDDRRDVDVPLTLR